MLFLLLLLLSGRLNYIIDSFFPPQHFIGLKIIWIGRHRNIYMRSRKMTNKVESYILVSFVCNSAKQLQNEIRSILTLEPCKLYHYYYCCVAECIEKRSKDFFLHIDSPFYLTECFGRTYARSKILVNIQHFSKCLMES